MSFNKRLFSTDDFMARPKKKRNGNGNGNGKKRNGNRQRDQTFDKKCFGDECFDTRDFFGGFKGGSPAGIPKADQDMNQGLSIPELGQDFNTRFGKIGTGFVEQTNTFKVGFSDVLTANGRTGQIIGEGAKIGSKGRGRPRGSGGKGKAAAAKTVDSSKKSVGAILGGAASKGIKGGISRLKAKASRGQSQFSTDELEGEKKVDKIQVERFRESIEAEKESKRESGAKILSEEGDKFEDIDMDMTDEEVEEENGEVIDKEMGDEEGVNGQK